jgi:alkylation response protein AidB-like acyl-CoA dehydrogenase
VAVTSERIASVEFDDVLVQAAQDLIDTLAANADAAERDGKLPEENIAALDAAGLRRLTLPRSAGGSEASALTILHVTDMLARGCASTSFVSTVYAASGYLICRLPDAGWQAFVSSDNPTSSITVNPGGTAVRDGDGYRVSGKWPFGTGQQHAGWGFLAAVIDGEDGEPDAGFFLVPREELTALDDWQVTGLCGTASNTLAGEDIYVPAERCLRVSDLLAGRSDSSLVADNPYYQHPAPAFTLACVTGTALGVAQAALDSFKSRVGSRGITYTSYLRQADASLTHHQIAEATMKIDHARFHAQRLATTAQLTADDLDLETRARCRADMGWAVRLCREASDVIQSASGANAIHKKDALQRILRDMQVISVHSLLLPSTNQEVYGRVLCGLDPGSPFL